MASTTTSADARGFEPATRVQESFLAAGEKRTLVWMALHTPACINSDHLTLLGFLAQCLAGICYVWAKPHPYALLLGVACLGLNWLGDSLDGTLARVRNRQRPRYGFYVDHITDTIAAFFLMGGLALSGYIHPAIAIGMLVAFLMLSIEAYLATYTIGEFRLSYWKFGPTEIRLLLAIGNVALLRHTVIVVFGWRVRLFDLGGAIAILGMSLMLIVSTVRNVLRLYREERMA